MQKIVIAKEAEKIRIDSYLSRDEFDMSRVKVQRMLENENILVNEKKVKAAYKLVVNDIITIKEEVVKQIELKAQEIPIEIIYEDDDIIVVNKPKGLVVHPANGNPDGTLVNAIMAICKDSLSGIGGEIRPRNRS